MNELSKNTLQNSLKDALWVCSSLFERVKASGSSANMSFKYDNHIYITGTGTCFGRLKEEDFAVVNLKGDWVKGVKASKELALHLIMYEKDENITSVLHTHSFYSTLWSCLEHENIVNCIPEYTPYLKMKLGTVGLIPYQKPGTEALFKDFKENIHKSDGFLLSNHGPIVGGKSILDAFYILEELEESCRIAWEIEGKQKKSLKI